MELGDRMLDLPYKVALKHLHWSFTRLYLEALLSRYRGNVTRAAIHAGMERESLHRLMRKFGVTAGPFRKGTTDERETD